MRHRRVFQAALCLAFSAAFLGTAPGAGAPAAQTLGAVDIVRDPSEVPPPLARRKAETVRVDLETVEVMGTLSEGTVYRYWTFNGKVPGPLIRVRVGDTVEVHLKNNEDSWMNHNVDFHAVTGPGGGAKATEAMPGEAKTFTFKALKPGLYVYHCATPMVASHIANGMYGMILVEPEGGLKPVDHEFYVMQGELYTDQAFGTPGQASESYDKLVNERPEYFLFNGAVGALSQRHPLKAKVGETVRILFGVGGPNYTSSFHVIGEIFDAVYLLGTTDPNGLIKDVQTVTVPPGGSTIVEFKLEVPGTFVLVDHALSRVQKGLVGILQVEGPANPVVFDAGPTAEESGYRH